MIDAKTLKLWLEQWFSEDQSPEYIAQRAYDAGRRAGMLEAAGICDSAAAEEQAHTLQRIGASRCAAAIREAAK